MIDFIILLVLAVMLGGAGFYVWKARKSGRKCIGCPNGTCPHAGTDRCCCGRK
ncbi:MAG: hypothetical protein ACI4MG_01440 [Aristaeellaceae bacterium]